MPNVKNILIIMADQLRWDYLSCYGHPHLETPDIDRLAARGVRFERAYVQSPVCGPSRASFYTGRTVFSHGATWNHVPLLIGELTLGDYLWAKRVTTAVVGKTHMVADKEGMARLGLNESTDIGCLISQPGFDPYERDDGLHPDNGLAKRGGKLRYNDWLREQGYDGKNPWNDYANSGESPEGEVLSGWYLNNSNLSARIKILLCVVYRVNPWPSATRSALMRYSGLLGLTALSKDQQRIVRQKIESEETIAAIAGHSSISQRTIIRIRNHA